MNATEERLVEELVKPMLGVAPESSSQELSELGADSMEIVHLLAQAEELFEVELSPADLMDEGISVASIAALVDRLRVAPQA